MKNRIAALLAFSITPLVGAEMSPPPRVVAEVVVSGGFSPEPYPRAQGVRVFEDGEVVHFSGAGRERLARLYPQLIEKLESKVERIRDAGLVDLDAGAPVCADVPETQYRVYRGRSAPIAIAGQRNCHRYVLPDGEGQEIRQFLDHLNALDL